MTSRKTIDQINSDELDQLYNQRDQLATALGELLDRFHPIPLDGYDGDRICHPINRTEYERWHAALTQEPTP